MALVILVPPGHFNYYRMLAISGVLAELKNMNVPFIFHSNMNNLSARLYSALTGIFLKEIRKANKENKPVPVSMWLLGHNRGEKKGGLFSIVELENNKRIVQLVEGVGLTPEAKKLITILTKADAEFSEAEKSLT